MIEFVSGHLGSGEWKIKQQDGIAFLSHRLAFSPRNDFRIGANEVLDVQVQGIKKGKRLAVIRFTEDRECQALIDEPDFEPLLALISSNTTAPVEVQNTSAWVKGFLIFLILCIIFEIFK